MAFPTTGEMLEAAYRQRLAILSGAQSVSVNGQSFALPSLDAVENTIRNLEAQQAADAAQSATGSDLIFGVTRFRGP